MRHLLFLVILTVSLTGCAVGFGSSAPRPTSIPHLSTPTVSAQSTPTITVSSAARKAIQDFSCATVPVASELQSASARYDDAHNAAAAQLTDAARLDMQDAITLAGRAQSQLSSLQPPATLARYQNLLSSAAASFLSGAPVLRDDYASSNLSAATRDGKTFLAGRTFLQKAALERQRVSRKIALPDESSPQCTNAYLRGFLNRTPVPPPAEPSATPAPRARATIARAAPTARPARTRRLRPTPRPNAHPIRTHTGLSASTRAYAASEGYVIGKVNDADLYLSAAFNLVRRGKSGNASALADRAGRLLYLAGKRSSQVHTPSRSFAGIRGDVQDSLANAYLATRKLRLTIIDLAGNNSKQASRDLAAARNALKLSETRSNRALRALHSRTS